MKKIIPVVIIVLILIGVGAFLFLRFKATPTSKNNKATSLKTDVGKEEKTENKTAGEAFTGKIKEAILKGVPMKCTWKDEETEVIGYLKNKLFFAEVTREGQKGFLLLKEKCMWTWDATKDEGVKMCFEEDLWDSSDILSEEANYNCSPSIILDNKFDIPSNIKFYDMDQGFEGMLEEYQDSQDE